MNSQQGVGSTPGTSTDGLNQGTTRWQIIEEAAKVEASPPA